MSHNKYSLPFKLTIVTEYMMNKKTKGIQAKLANKYGISKNSVGNWIKKYQETVNTKASNLNKAYNEHLFPSNQDSLLIENTILKSIIVEKEIELNQLRNRKRFKNMKF
ncbi:helix-turn-helix domain-containing protein [Priestia megaterium]|uniref:helix-turn-helix domain-containing protein n=1 Tax=Priestia megaterium TaxID=1404 RepID=UPI00345A76EE